MDAFQILVIILAVFLALFLILGIVLLVMLIQVSVKIKRIARTVGETADNFKQFTDNLRRIVSPAIITQLVVKWVRNIIKKKGSGNE